MKSLIYIPFFILFTFLSGCYDVVELDLKEGTSLLVVDGRITYRIPYYDFKGDLVDVSQPDTIKLTKTINYNSTGAYPTVSGAQLRITDNTSGVSELLSEVAPGKYIISNMRGQINHSYTLNIKTGADEYTASTEITRVPPIDTLTAIFKPQSGAFEEGYYVLYYGPELPGLGDYFRFKIYINDRLLNDGDNIFVRSDQFVDGNYIQDAEMNFADPAKLNDKIKIETCSITRDAYYFYNEMFIQANNDDAAIFANPYANVRTNILSVNPSSPKAIGYFGGQAVYSYEIMVKK